ncbi:MAG TPA: hypothetical protein VGN57_11895 [Pirellulaceae bacterium]|nr:hypothetical protein [Pirellulaceae bacterium]
MPSRRRFLGAAATLTAAAALPRPRLRAAEPPAALRDREAKFAKELALVADKCEELGLSAESSITRQWAVVPRPDQRFLYLPDEDVLPPDESLSDAGRFWKRKFLEVRAAFAADLFALAVDPKSEMLWSDRFRLIWRTLREDPSHADARRILAIEPPDREGRPAVERVRVSDGRYEYPDVGWRARSWTSCKSDRFDLATNAGADAGRDLARRLERYRLIWLQLFPERWLGESEFQKSLEPGRFLRYPNKTHRVVLFADHAKYVAYLEQYVPRVGESKGVYSDQRKVSYFFAGDDADESTIIHELGHQLFQEIGSVGDEVGRACNFWVVEGIATYLESLRPEGSRQVLGGFTSKRMQNARYRLRHAGQWMPADEFADLAFSEFAQQEDLPFVYSQGAGLSHFFLHGVPDSTRAGFLQYLDDVYLDRDPPDALFRRTGMTPEEIHEGYLPFLDVTDDDLAAVGEAEALAAVDLCLAQTSVTDRGMRDVARFVNLDWLDLAGTKLSPAGVREVGALKKLVTLDLQGASVDEEALHAIASLPRLEDLVLSDANVDDRSLAALGLCKTLKTLALNRTAVTDAGVEKLVAALPSLQSLSVVGTSVSQATAKKLESSRRGLSVRAS